MHICIVRKPEEWLRPVLCDGFRLSVGRLLNMLAAATIAMAIVPVDSVAQSGDGTHEWVVFTSGRSGSGDVFALDPGTGETIVLASTPMPEGGVRYDIANKRVVYQRYERGRTLLVAGDGVLFEDPGADAAPEWSPDGWRIVYSDDRDGKEDLFVARPDATGARQLTNDSAPDRYPAWSPDSSTIVFSRREESGWDLFTLDIGNGEATPRRLTERGVFVGHPAWSPDGGSIAFDMRYEDQMEIAVFDLSSKEIRRMTDRPGDDLAPSWSSDGSRIVFAGQPDSTRNWDVWMVDVETLELERLTEDPAYDGGPVFVPGAVLGR